MSKYNFMKNLEKKLNSMKIKKSQEKFFDFIKNCSLIKLNIIYNILKIQYHRKNLFKNEFLQTI